jgi:hypothetical protein
VYLLAVGINGLVEGRQQMHFAFAQQERFLDLGTWGRHACQIRRQTGTLAAAQRSELFSDVVLQRKMIELFGESDYWTNAAVNGLINLFSASHLMLPPRNYSTRRIYQSVLHNLSVGVERMKGEGWKDA